LLLILRRRLVVGAGGEALLRLFGLQLLRDRRLRRLERDGGLALERIPLREVLLERFGAGRGGRHPLPFEREAGAAAARARILLAQLLHQLARLLHGALRFVAQALELGARACAPALSLTRSA